MYIIEICIYKRQNKSSRSWERERTESQKDQELQNSIHIKKEYNGTGFLNSEFDPRE